MYQFDIFVTQRNDQHMDTFDWCVDLDRSHRRRSIFVQEIRGRSVYVEFDSYLLLDVYRDADRQYDLSYVQMFTSEGMRTFVIVRHIRNSFAHVCEKYDRRIFGLLL